MSTTAILAFNFWTHSRNKKSTNPPNVTYKSSTRQHRKSIQSLHFKCGCPSLVASIQYRTMWKMVTISSSVPESRSWIMDKSVFAEHYDVTVKLAFDFLSIKCHHVTILHFWTFVKHVVIIHSEFLGYDSKHVSWGYSDLSYHKIQNPSGCLCQILKKILKAFQRYHVHKNETEGCMDRETDKQKTW